MNYKSKLHLVSILMITLLTSGYAQTNSGDSSCIKCEEKIKQAMQNWKQTILNSNETEPVSFAKLFKVDNEETKKLALDKMTADTAFMAYVSWRNNREEIRFIRQGECYGKKATIVMNGYVTTRKYWTKKEKIKMLTRHLNEIAYCYEVIYKNKDTTVSVPALCSNTGMIYDSILSTSQFANDNN